MNIADYPRVKAVVLDIAYDNGMVNRVEPKEATLQRLEEALGAEGVYTEDVDALEAWLGTLTKDQLDTLASGEHGDMGELVSQAPKNWRGESVARLFDDVFDF